MRLPHLRRAATISLLALALAACSFSADTATPPLPPASSNSPRPALTIPLTDHDQASQNRVAAEIAAAPADAEWPAYVRAYSQTRRAVCAVTPNQAACRRICAAEGNRLAFCSRTGAQEGGS